jgi:predicted DNA-binding antitoxin AbrB/MazE fold protein
MGKTVRTKYSKGVIKPLEKVDIEEGKEITVTIIEFPMPMKKANSLELTAEGIGQC